MADKALEVVNDEEDLDIIDTLSDVVSISGGIAAGGVVGAALNEIVPVAKNTVETVVRWVGIGCASFATQHVTSNAINKNLIEFRGFLHKITTDDESATN